jgi:RimJ/RimL family protein N-acetyltransferase
LDPPQLLNNPDYTGKYEPITQITKKSLEKSYQNLLDEQWWFISNDDGLIGFLSNCLRDNSQEIRYILDPQERGKGYESEAVQIIVDYLFLNHDVIRIQAEIRSEDDQSQKTLENRSFVREGLLRRRRYIRGTWSDTLRYSFLREEWVGPHIKL